MEVFVQPDRDGDACYIGFGDKVFDAHSVHKSVRVSDDITLDYGADNRLVGVDVMNAEEVLGPDFWDMRFDMLVGVKEAADLAGIKRSNFIRDYANQSDFPAPVCELATGRIWLKSQVLGYLQQRKSKKRNQQRAHEAGVFSAALASLKTSDELFLRNSALGYLRGLVKRDVKNPPTIEDIVAENLREDRLAVRRAQEGGVDEYVQMAWDVHSKYSPALTSLVAGLIGAEQARAVVKETFVAALKGIQTGTVDLSEQPLTTWLLSLTRESFSKRGSVIPDLSTHSGQDALEEITNARRLEQALSEHEARLARLRSEEFMVSYLIDITDGEFVPILDVVNITRTEVRTRLRRRLADIQSQIAFA